jgi:hypothetical protein
MMGPPIRWSLGMTQRYNFYEKTYLQEKTSDRNKVR